MRNYPGNYIFAFFFTLFESVTVGYIVSMYTASSVCLVFVITLVITVALTVYAMQTSTDYTALGGYMLSALLALMMFGFLCMFFPQVEFMQKVYSGRGALVFAGFIVFDTQRILGGKHRFKFDVDDMFSLQSRYISMS